MADLDQPGDVALADVRRPPLPMWSSSGCDPLVGLLGPGDDEGEPAGADDLAVAADRRGEEVDAALRAGGPHRRRATRSRPSSSRRRCPGTSSGSASRPPSPTSTCSRSAGGRDHREDDVEAAQLGDRVGDDAADLGQRLGLGPGAVPDGHVLAGPGQPGGHRGTHAAGTDPADATVTGRVECRWSFMSAPRWSCRSVGTVAAAEAVGTVGEPGGQPVGGAGAVPGRDVGAAVVAVLEHQQLGRSRRRCRAAARRAATGSAGPAGRRRSAAGRSGRRRRPSRRQGERDLRAPRRRWRRRTRTRKVSRVSCGQPRPSTRRSRTARPARRRRATRSPSAAATRGA